MKARLREVLVDDGDRVAVGQILAHLDDTVAAAQVAEVEARARYALAESDRLERLATAGQCGAQRGRPGRQRGAGAGGRGRGGAAQAR